MKYLFLYLLVLTGLILTSCSSKSGKFSNIKEEKAVDYVRKNLKKQGRLIDYQIVNGPMPIELMPDEFKSYRDAVYKAQLDYRACKVRGLNAGMEKAVNTIAECQEEIKSKIEDMPRDTNSYIMVLATVQENSAARGRKSNVIAVFNAETLNMEKWATVTTPIQNNAILIANALGGTLLSYGMDMNHNLDSLASAVTSPVVQFILRSTPK